jgi:hypothetical protein
MTNFTVRRRNALHSLSNILLTKPLLSSALKRILEAKSGFSNASGKRQPTEYILRNGPNRPRWFNVDASSIVGR